MSETKQADIHSIKKGSYIVVEGEACRVTDIQQSAPGKHGHAKFRVTAVGLIDEKKRVFIKPGGTNVDVPIINKKQAQVLSLKEESKTVEGKTTVKHFANVMDLESYETFDIDIPEEMLDKVQEGSQVFYWEVMGKRLIQRMA